jgi:hypothetical protein
LAAAKTIRQRKARAWALFGRRAQRSQHLSLLVLEHDIDTSGHQPPIVACDGDDFDVPASMPAD